MSDMQTREHDATSERRGLDRELGTKSSVKHRALLTRASLDRDNTEPSTIGRHVKVCGDIGPRIGEDGSPRCGRVMHHEGRHHTNVEWSGFNEGWPGAAQGAWDQPDFDYRDHFTGPVIP